MRERERESERGESVRLRSREGRFVAPDERAGEKREGELERKKRRRVVRRCFATERGESGARDETVSKVLHSASSDSRLPTIPSSVSFSPFLSAAVPPDVSFSALSIPVDLQLLQPVSSLHLSFFCSSCPCQMPAFVLAVLSNSDGIIFLFVCRSRS